MFRRKISLSSSGSKNHQKEWASSVCRLLLGFLAVWRQYVPSKRRAVSELHCVTTWKTVFCLVTTVRTSNPTYWAFHYAASYMPCCYQCHKTFSLFNSWYVLKIDPECIRCNWKLRTISGHEFHIQNQEKIPSSACVRKHLICGSQPHVNTQMLISYAGAGSNIKTETNDNTKIGLTNRSNIRTPSCNIKLYHLDKWTTSLREVQELYTRN
jgi:hypothetical protein